MHLNKNMIIGKKIEEAIKINFFARCNKYLGSDRNNLCKNVSLL